MLKTLPLKFENLDPCSAELSSHLVPLLTSPPPWPLQTISILENMRLQFNKSRSSNSFGGNPSILARSLATSWQIFLSRAPWRVRYIQDHQFFFSKEEEMLMLGKGTQNY